MFQISLYIVATRFPFSGNKEPIQEKTDRRTEKYVTRGRVQVQREGEIKTARQIGRRKGR